MFHFIRNRMGLSHFRVSVPLPRNCSPLSSLAVAPTVSPPDVSSNRQHRSLTASYLIDSCALAPERASYISRYLKLKTSQTADSVLAFLQNHGFSQTQVSNIVTRCPRILLYDPEKAFLPKLRFLNSAGFSGTDVVKTINAFPRILQASLETRIAPAVDFLRGMLHSDGRIIEAVRRCPLLLVSDLQASFANNIQILREIGVPEPRILRVVALYPAPCLRNTRHFRRIVEEVKDMGLNPSEGNFLWAVRALSQVGKSTWEKKVELYKKWGCSEDDVLMAFSKYPMCMTVSEVKLTRAMDFLVNQMGYETLAIMKAPTLINMSFEKRILPRCFAYSYLVDKGIMKKKGEVFNFSSWLKYSESTFLNKVLKSYEKGAPELLKLYQDKKALAK